MKWLRTEDYDLNEFNTGRLVLAYSPLYIMSSGMRFRILQDQFLRFCGEVELFCYLDEIENTIGD